MIPPANSLAFLEGAQAKRAQTPLASNPYPDGKIGKSWRAGWVRAQKDLEDAAIEGETT